MNQNMPWPMHLPCIACDAWAIEPRPDFWSWHLFIPRQIRQFVCQVCYVQYVGTLPHCQTTAEFRAPTWHVRVVTWNMTWLTFFLRPIIGDRLKSRPLLVLSRFNSKNILKTTGHIMIIWDVWII
jgi:hypothetical protein